MALNPADFDLDKCHFEGGKIVADEGQNWIYFSPKALTLGKDNVYAVTVTFELTNPDPTFQALYAYSLRPDANLNDSMWYTLYNNDLYLAGSTSYTVELGYGHGDFGSAMADGETRVLFECLRYMEITNVSWTFAPKKWMYGPPVDLDDTPEEAWEDVDLVEADYENWYSSACKVYDDVVFAAWMHQGEGNNSPLDGGGERSFEGSAARHVDGDPPTVEKGPRFLGPRTEDLPGFDLAYFSDKPWWNPAETSDQSAELSYVYRLGEGLAYVQQYLHYYPNDTLGYVVRVDRDTLEATYVRAVRTDSVEWTPDGWAWPPCYGPDRTLTQVTVEHMYPFGHPNWVERPHGDFGDRLMISLGADGEELARKYVMSYDWFKPGGRVVPGGPLTNPSLFYSHFHWNDVMCIVDCHDYFISFGLNSSTADQVSVWRHDVIDHLPSDEPTRVYTEARNAAGSFPWDFDATYACHMPNGLIYILDCDYGGPSWNINARFRVFDPAAQTLEVRGVTHGPPPGFGAHLMDWASIEPLDDDRAFWGIMDYWENETRGYRIGVFDGNAVTDVQTIYPFRASNDPYRTRDHSSSNSGEAYHLGDGRVMAVLNVDESSMPNDTGTPGNPVKFNVTKAVAARLWPLSKATGELRSTRRHYRRNH